MRRRRKWLNLALMGFIAAAIAAPVGVVVAESETEESAGAKRVDALTAERMKAEVLEEIARRNAEEPEKAPPPMPANTYTYIPPNIYPETRESCEKAQVGEPKYGVCRLIMMVVRGEARSGAYTAQQFQDTLATKGGE
jgi:hypothetical protein